MQRTILKLVLPLCFLVIFTISGVSPIEATFQSDPLNDVWKKSSATSGDHADHIDLQQVILQGSSVIITTDGDLTTLTSNIVTYILILFSDDGDPTNFEACFIFSQIGNSDRFVSWTISDPFSDSEVEWQYDYSGSHYRIKNNELQTNFIEYDQIGFSEVLIVTLTNDAGSVYFDWTPNFYRFPLIEEIISKLIPQQRTPSKTSTTTSSTTTPQTTTPPTTAPQPTTSIPLTSTTPIPSTNINPVIISTQTSNLNSTIITQSDKKSETVASSSEPGDRSDLITSGYTLIVVLLAIPPLVIIKRLLWKK